ncbi:hypothetical protein [Micrococcus luteus]|uniref:hypothetical protein n=1 Tax=Micrococcus luteus TaxID=1270 RepID=UPI00381897B0|nr:hypothetical protein [Micrococcus luteus]
MNTSTATPARLNGNQTFALTAVLNVLRPDWAQTGIAGRTIEKQNTTGEFPDRPFEDTLRAAINYATATRGDGQPRWVSPVFLAANGPHWEDTL